MIIGLGTDIILIDRVVNAIRSERLLKRLFSDNEIKLIEKNKKISASNFCVKESFVKALGTGFRNININEIEVLRDELSKPYINLLGKAKGLVSEDTNIFVTISHTSEHVTSTVILERCI